MNKKLKMLNKVFGISIISLMLFGCYNDNNLINKSNNQQTTLFGATVGDLTTEDEVVTPSELEKKLSKFQPGGDDYEYAKFVIPMDYMFNEHFISGINIELKATTNNFGITDWTPSKTSLLYMAYTGKCDWENNDPDDELCFDKRTIYIRGIGGYNWIETGEGFTTDFSASGNDMGRIYQKVNDHMQCSMSNDEQTRAHEIIIVVHKSDLIRTINDNSWFKKDNDQLQWIFTYIDSNGSAVRRNYSTSTLWMEIKPTWHKTDPMKHSAGILKCSWCNN